MPLVVELELSGPSKVRVPMKAPHAAIAARIDTAHHAAVKLFTIAPPHDICGGVALRVGMLRDALAEDLAQSLERDPTVRLGAHRFTYTGLRVAEQMSWDEMQSVTDEKRWNVEFRTPTTFRHRGRTSPWPDPTAIARSLVARWAGVHPDSSLRLDPHLGRSVWVSDISGRSVVVAGPNSTVSGFLGRISYVGDPADGSAALFELLLRFAKFAGIGSFTTFGFGQIDVHAGNPGRCGEVSSLSAEQCRWG